MKPTARERANVARPGKRQTLAGLDPYHRLLREAQEQPSLPYNNIQRLNPGSFSVPRSSPFAALGRGLPQPNPSLPTSSGPETPRDNQHSDQEKWQPQMPPRAVLGAETEWPTVPRQVSDSDSLDSSRFETLEMETRPSSRRPREEGSNLDERLSWRPLFLYRRILIALVALFSALFVLVEFLLVLSDRTDGLFDATSVSWYLWQYGSVLVSVIAVSIWAKVEFQAKAMAPWIRMSQSFEKVETSLLLDYVSMARPLAMIRSSRNGDVVVFGSSIIGMALLGLVLMAPTLLTPLTIPTLIPDAPITLKTAFVDDARGLAEIDSWPYVNMLELQTSNLGLPPGVSSQFAFQDFDSSFQSPTLFNATVDGLVGGLICQEAVARLTRARNISDARSFLDIEVSTLDCKVNQTVELDNSLVPGQNRDGSSNQVLAMQPGSCGSSQALDDQRLVVISGVARFGRGPADNLLIVDLTQSTSLICRPDYIITQVQVAKNQTRLVSESVIAGRGQRQRRLSSVHPWLIAQSHFDSYQDRPEGPGFVGIASKLYETQVVDMDEPMAAVIMTRRKRAGKTPRLSSFQEVKSLSDMVQDYFQAYSALVAAGGLTRSISEPSIAAAVVMQRRLVLRTIPTHCAAGILGFCGVGAFALVFLVPRRGFLPRDPGTIAGMATLLADSDGLIEALRGTGGLDMDAIRERLGRKTFKAGMEDSSRNGRSAIPSFRIRAAAKGSRETHPYDNKGPKALWEKPLLLRWLVRLLAGFVAVALLVVLEAGLQASKQGNGLGLMSNSKADYAYFSWTLVPVLALMPLSEYLLWADLHTRATAPFLRLLRGADFSESLGLKLLGVPRIMMVRKALLTRNYSVVLATLTALVSPLLLVASAGLTKTAPLNMFEDISTVNAMRVMKIAILQDPISTRILQGLLGAVLILLLLSSFTGGGSGGLPRPTTSIASQAAYLVDGNLLEALPADAKSLSLSEIEENLHRDYEVMYADLAWETASSTTPGAGDGEGVALFGVRITRWGGTNMQVPRSRSQA